MRKTISRLQLRLLLIVVLGAALPGDVRASLLGQPAPEISNEVWLNSPALRLADLRGKVVLLEFWTYG